LTDIVGHSNSVTVLDTEFKSNICSTKSDPTSDTESGTGNLTGSFRSATSAYYVNAEDFTVDKLSKIQGCASAILSANPNYNKDDVLKKKLDSSLKAE
jgi:hypothetical protein